MNSSTRQETLMKSYFAKFNNMRRLYTITDEAVTPEGKAINEVQRLKALWRVELLLRSLQEIRETGEGNTNGNQVL